MQILEWLQLVWREACTCKSLDIPFNFHMYIQNSMLPSSHMDPKVSQGVFEVLPHHRVEACMTAALEDSGH